MKVTPSKAASAKKSRYHCLPLGVQDRSMRGGVVAIVSRRGEHIDCQKMRPYTDLCGESGKVARILKRRK